MNRQSLARHQLILRSSLAGIYVLSFLAGLTARSADCFAPPPGLVGWWPAEGNGADVVGGHTAVLLNGVGYTTGEVGRAFDFNGIDGRVIVSNTPALDFSTGDFSIETWIRPLFSVTDYGVMDVVSKRLAPNIYQSLGYELALVDGRLALRLSTSIAGNGALFGPAGPDLRDGSFHHVALTLARNSTTGGQMYVDGQPILTFDATSQNGSLSTSEPLRIGNHATSSLNCYFKGQIDEVSLYARALDPGEVQAIYSAGTAGKCNPPVIMTQPRSQVGYWGKSVTFEVTASGASPLTYQWSKDGAPITGATNSSLVLTNLQMADAGVYTVIVNNAVGSVTSGPATLTMNPAGVAVALYTGITIDGVVGLTYGIQCSTNLDDPNSWQGAANVPLGSPTQLWFDLRPAIQSQRYYRVVPGPISVP